MQMSAFNWLRMIIPFGYLTGTVALAMAGKLILLNIVILHLGLGVATWFGTMAVLLRLGIRPSFKPEAGLGKEMLRYGAKVQVGNVSGMANQSLDQVLMAAWLPPVYLGLYVVAVSSAALSQVFSQAVKMVATPASRNASQGRNARRSCRECSADTGCLAFLSPWRFQQSCP